MRGLFGITQNKPFWPINSESFSLDRNTNNKFHNDKIFTKKENYIIGLDGVILNKSELEKGYDSWEDYFLNNINQLGKVLQKLKGSFHGVIYDLESKELILFNDPTANKNFVYYLIDNELVFHCDDVALIQLLHKENKEITIHKPSIYAFLAYGFLPSKWSWIQHCKRLEPGSIVKFKNGQITQKQYKTFVSEPSVQDNKTDYLENFQHLFSKAVFLQYQKDVAYGYKHYATLSGGLDSRSTVLQAYDLGFSKQTTFTCSQTNYADHTIAKKISMDYGFKHQFFPLDGPNHLLYLPKNAKEIGGSALYSGPAHVIQGIEQNWSSAFGLIHSGHVGDGVMGSFLSSTQLKSADINYGRVGAHLLPHDPKIDHIIESKHGLEETFKLNERGFHGAAGGVWGLEHLSYNISPFVDHDVLDFLLHLPYDVKFKRKIYVEWLIKFHKDWAQYPLESLHAKPNAFWKFKYQKAYLRVRFGWQKLLSRNFRLLHDMAPEQYWFENDKKLQSYYNQSFEEAITLGKSLEIPYIENIRAMHDSKYFINRSKALHVAHIIHLIYNKHCFNVY